jgi:hypothetical protein
MTKGKDARARARTANNQSLTAIDSNHLDSLMPQLTADDLACLTIRESLVGSQGPGLRPASRLLWIERQRRID